MIRSAIWISILSLTLSIISFLNQTVIANYFGAAKELDLFLAASSLPTLIAAIIGSSFSYSLTPYLIRARIQTSKTCNFHIGSLFGKIAIFGAIACLIGVLLLNFALSKLYPEFVKYNYKSLLLINSISWISAYLSILIGFFVSLFNSNERFGFPLLLNFIPFLTSITAIYFFSNSLGVIAIPAGLLGGSLLIFIISVFANQKYISFGRVEHTESSEINQFLKKMPIIAITMLCFTVYQSIDAYWAPQLGTSNLSYLGYCQRILIAVGTLVIIGPSTVLIPRLTLAITENRETDFLNDSAIVVKLIFSLASLFAVIGSITASSIIEVLFERGAFSHQDTLGIASILPYMLTGMIFMLCVVMLFRAFFVNKMGNKVAYLGLICTFLYFSLSGIGAITFGIKGIAIAYIITWISVFFISLSLIFKGNYKIIYNSHNLFFVLKQLTLLCIIGLVVTAINSLILNFRFGNSFFTSIFTVIINGIIGISTYLILSITILKQYEIKILLDKIVSSILNPVSKESHF